MEQIRALNALEPFILLSKSANSPRAAADLITQATAAPNTYVFVELLHTPNVQALRQSDEYASYLRLLEIFAWGTWEDYSSTSSSLPPLNPQQTLKLRLLTLLTLAPTTHTYTSLQTALSLPDPLALESLVTTAIYSSLLAGTLNPSQGTLSITSVAPLRDLRPSSVSDLRAQLGAWEARCSSTLNELEAEIARIKRVALERKRMELRVEQAFEAAINEEGEQKELTGTRSGRDRKGKGTELGGRNFPVMFQQSSGLGGKRGPGSDVDEEGDVDEMDVDEAIGGNAGGQGATSGRGAKRAAASAALGRMTGARRGAFE